VGVFWEADRRARGGQWEGVRGQPSVSAAMQTRPRFGPILGHPGVGVFWEAWGRRVSGSDAQPSPT
jgi:hypothetical protein